ncbi:LysR family transcriptional regulator, regulator of gene expression of beta-lactamase [Lysobacter sp. yr284]|uniref:LysR family transcriptional regulator n=1 Tax=Lysobacter sp. yr284 TaxID=1761791 RepID=UPI000897EDEF|nr:LysR family transcriptional regulator [Lysobacter sp. yr284]SDY90471.1 LysR family transcriptional regulator, regulator of gene expression of beta-lactamase [Lysobacter sp. yr284]
MAHTRINLGALKAFEAAARALSLTRAADELNVTQAAVSHQVRLLENQLGVELFRRLPRGLALTDEGLGLLPAIQEAFDRIDSALDRVGDGLAREVVHVGAVGTFASGWLLPRLAEFARLHPSVDVRVSTNNNRVDPAAEGLDYAVRFGRGTWPGMESRFLMPAPLTPLCTPAIAQQLREPAELARFALLRSYFVDDWRLWFEAARAVPCGPINGAIFDSSLTMVQCALQGLGVALAPPSMFARELAQGLLVQPFDIALDAGGYWLTRLALKPAGDGASAFAGWLERACAE